MGEEWPSNYMQNDESSQNQNQKARKRERDLSHLILGEMTATTTEISSFFPPVNLFPTSLALRANGTSSTSVSMSSNDEVAAGEW